MRVEREAAKDKTNVRREQVKKNAEKEEMGEENKKSVGGVT